MTLDELRAMKAKCSEVQSTLKKDIAYICNDNRKEEHIFSDCWEDFVAKIRELFEFLPEAKDISDYCSGGTNKEYQLSRYNYPVLVVRCGYVWKPYVRKIVLGYDTLDDNKVWVTIYEDKVTISQKYGGEVELDFRSEQTRMLRLMEYRDRLYELAKEAVADCQQRVTENLLHRNKRVLEYAEKIKNYK